MLENERAEATGLENERVVEERRVDFEEDIARINIQFATARDLLEQEISSLQHINSFCFRVTLDPAREGDVRRFMQLAGVAPEARDIVFSTAQALLQEWVDSSADEQPAEGKQ